MALKITIEEVYDLVCASGFKGITIKAAAEDLEITYQSARRYLNLLVERNLAIAKDNLLGSTNSKVYCSKESRIMPRIKHYNLDQDDIYLSRLLQTLITIPVDEQMQVKLTKKMGLYIAELAEIAALWHENETIGKKRIEDLRADMEVAKTRAMWQVRVYDYLLKHGGLWNKRYAPTLWFGDADLSFLPEVAHTFYQKAKADNYVEPTNVDID